VKEPLAQTPSSLSASAVAVRAGAALPPHPRPISAPAQPPLLVLTGAELEQVLEIPALVDAIEAVLFAHARGQTTMPPKIYLSLPEHDGDFRAMPARAAGLAGMKWVSVHPRNPFTCGLPSVMGIVVVNDPATGLPLALLEGTVVTRRRTGAAAGVATRHLARPDARTLGQIGCGGMAGDLVRAVAVVRDLTEIVLWSQHPAQAETLAGTLAPLPARVGSLEEAAACAIVTTATPSAAPLFPAAWGAGSARGIQSHRAQRVGEGMQWFTSPPEDDRGVGGSLEGSAGALVRRSGQSAGAAAASAIAASTSPWHGSGAHQQASLLPRSVWTFCRIHRARGSSLSSTHRRNCAMASRFDVPSPGRNGFPQGEAARRARGTARPM